MNNKLKYIEFNKAFAELIDLANQNNFDNIEILRWIVVKVLRLKRQEFNNIIQVDEQSLERMKKALIRYINGESLSKIFGFVEFYGNFFKVTENVFDPRLSTECLVKSVIDENTLTAPKIIDLCCGSGCIAITLSKLLGKQVDAVDISPLVLEVANENCQNLQANVNFIQLDLNDNWHNALKQKYDVIVSNPPYWNSSKILNSKEIINGNPLNAFDGGEDGLHFIKIIIENAVHFLNKNGMIFLEMEPDQEANIRNLLKNKFSHIKTYNDHRNITRVISAKLN